MRGIFTNEGADRMKKILTFLSDNPKKHKQGIWISQGTHTAAELNSTKTWTCETAGCLAGWGALMAGWLPVIDEKYINPYYDSVSVEKVIKEYEGLELPIWEAAIIAFIGQNQFDRSDIYRQHSYGEELSYFCSAPDTPTRKVWKMFAPDNSLNKLWEMAKHYSDGYIVKPAEDGESVNA